MSNTETERLALPEDAYGFVVLNKQAEPTYFTPSDRAQAEKAFMDYGSALIPVYRRSALRAPQRAGRPRAWIANDPEGGPYLTWSEQAAKNYPNPEALYAYPPAPQGEAREAVLAEREACALVADEHASWAEDKIDNETSIFGTVSNTANDVAEMIRHREDPKWQGLRKCASERPAAQPQGETREEDDPADLWEEWLKETSEEYRTPQSAMAFVVDRLFTSRAPERPAPQLLREALNRDDIALILINSSRVYHGLDPIPLERLKSLRMWPPKGERYAQADAILASLAPASANEVKPDLLARIDAMKAAYPRPAERGEYAAQTALFDLYETADKVKAAEGGVP